MSISTWATPKTWTAALVTVAEGNQYWRDALKALKVSADGNCQGRLTLESGVPSSSTDQTAKTAVKFTPYGGNRLSLYNAGSSFWETGTFAELSLSIAGYTADTLYDIWVYDNAGTITLDSTAWTSSGAGTSARATALVLQDGVYAKTGSLGRRYLGTIKITGTIGQTEDSVAKRYVWNYYNRVPRELRVIEATGSWTYNSGTIRQANGAAGNKIEFIVGVNEEIIDCDVLAAGAAGAGGDFPYVTIGLDSITATATGVRFIGPRQDTGGYQQPLIAKLRTYPGIGYHYLAWLEARSGAATATFSSADSVTSAGIGAIWRC